MDYRNDNRTPRDRVDDEFFRSLLREEDEEQEMRRNRGRTRMTGATVHERSHGNSRMNSRNYRERSSQDSCPRTSCTRETNNVNSCPTDSWGDDCLSGYPLGMVYIPAQSFREIMDTQSALRAGTIFNELYLPFYHSGCKGDACR